jgi:hypothetical protein
VQAREWALVQVPVQLQVEATQCGVAAGKKHLA